ncbi:MAG: hypothetical protein WDW38_010832 [Sanguina aurantia]
MQVALWLNDEWPVPELVEMHGKLAQAVSDAYRVIRIRGEDDMGGVLLSIGNELMTFQSFRPTFTDPFEVANKSIELLMLKAGADVCCVSDQDRERATAVTLP